MNTRHRLLLGLAVLVALAGCSSGSGTTSPRRRPTDVGALEPGGDGSSEPSPTPTAQDVMALPDFAPLEPGTYFIDPDGDPSTPLRVTYEVPPEGWCACGSARTPRRDGCSSSGCPGLPSHVGVSITTVTNLVRHGCRDHS